ncbi:hypothetical protein KCP76_20795 [Salmonella enterica subsp. enterica serovar Weltevreden]|nr:hypothetical protein KCP76_20795 [Salmonella enterica subsp. enterica serovar Weltevreden]
MSPGGPAGAQLAVNPAVTAGAAFYRSKLFSDPSCPRALVPDGVVKVCSV